MTTTDAATTSHDQVPSSPARLSASAPTATATAHASRGSDAIRRRMIGVQRQTVETQRRPS